MFCEYFARQKFDVAIDRIVRFLACELNGKMELHDISFIDRFHSEMPGSENFMSPLNAQMWISFMFTAVSDDMKDSWNESTNEKFMQFNKDVMKFLMMDTWVDVENKIQMVVQPKLIPEQNSTKTEWKTIYKENKEHKGYRPSYLDWYQKK